MRQGEEHCHPFLDALDVLTVLDALDVLTVLDVLATLAAFCLLWL